MYWNTLPGRSASYLRWQELETQLGHILKGAKRVAMEYSPRNAIPYLSKVDAGMVDLVRSLGCDVVSSGGFLQYYTCVMTKEQLESQIEAAEFLDRTAERSWQMIREKLGSITEYQVREFIVGEFERHGFTSEGLPICAVNEHSADPHFAFTR